jgi:hypothetical protein
VPGLLDWLRLRSAGHPPALREARDPAEDRGFRALTPGPRTDRDLPPGEWRELLQEAYLAYCTNPLAYAIIEMGVNFILGGGVRLEAPGQAAQRALDRFWDDPHNRMAERVYTLATELALYGELFVRFFTDPLTGRTVIRTIDPLRISAIETHPDDVERHLRYCLDYDTWIDALEVECFQVNRVSNALRGRSDLATVLPWLRRYREWLTDRVRVNRFKSAFVYDVTIHGAGAATLQARRAEYAEPPEPGTVIFHNESEQWQAVQPRIDADDVQADGHAIKLMIAAGAGLPEHYLGEGGNVNRATAAEMGLPTMKRFQRRQEYFRYILQRIARRVLLAAAAAGRLSVRSAERPVAVVFEELQDRDRAEMATAMQAFSQALATATARGWLSPQEARTLWWRHLGEQPADAAEDAPGEGEPVQGPPKTPWTGEGEPVQGPGSLPAGAPAPSS